MEARLNLYQNTVALKAAKHITSADHVITDAILPTVTQELVKLRASQINGCGFCADMHTKDALHAGESQSASTWSQPGARQPASPKPSAPPLSSPSRAPGSPTRPEASPTRFGRRPPSTTTRNSSARWSR